MTSRRRLMIKNRHPRVDWVCLRNLINRHCARALVIYVSARIIFAHRWPEPLLMAIFNLANEAFQSEVRRKQTPNEQKRLAESH
jgi:hypothetical protein